MRHREDSWHVNYYDAPATLHPRARSSNECKRCWLVNERKYCAFSKILCTSCSAASPQSFVVSLPSQHTGICSHKPQLLLRAIFSAGLPTYPCKISKHLRKGCVPLSKISGTHHPPGPMQESTQIPPQESLWEEGWEDKYTADTWWSQPKRIPLLQLLGFLITIGCTNSFN